MVGGARSMVERMVNMLRLIVFATVFAMCLVSVVRAAGGDLNWDYTSAVANKQDIKASAFDSSGNIILVGVDNEAAFSNYLLAKVSADGSGFVWPSITFDLNSGIDVATAVVVDSHDDIIVTGYAHNGVSYDIHTIKYAGADGAVMWQHTYDGLANGDDIATAIAIDSFNNVYVGGYQQGSSGKDDFVVIKYLSSGPNADDTPAWVTTFNGSADGHDRLAAIGVNSNGLAFTGESESATPGDFDMLTHKLNFDGTFAWTSPHVYSDSGDGKGNAITLDSVGNVIATGYVDNGSRSMYTAKYPLADGQLVWQKVHAGETIEGGHAVVVDDTDDVYVTGSSYSLTTAYDVYTAKYQGSDPVAGEPVTLWDDSYNTSNGNHDLGLQVAVDNDGDVYVSAYSNDASGGFDDILVLKYARDTGNRLWPQTLYDLAGLHDRPVAITHTDSGAVMVAGWAETAATGYDLLVLSYDPGALNQPTDLQANLVSNTEVDLLWTDNSDDEDNFVLERKAEFDSDYGVIATLGYNTVTYNDNGLTPDTRYEYRLRATSATDGNSAYSNIASIRTTVISYAAPSWLHIHAGADAGDDDPYAIDTGADQHPVVTGSSYSIEGGYDYLTVKLDRSDAAVEQWQARYNDDDNEGDTATSIVVDSQNRVVVTGYSSLYGGGASNTNDIYTLGYPSTGPPATWDDQYNGPAGNDDKSSAVDVAKDGSDNSVVVGYGKNASLNDDIYVIKFDPDGNRLWAATPYDGGGNDYPAAVAFDMQGNVMVAGRNHDGSDFDWFVAKYDTNDGSLVWVANPHAYAANGSNYAEAVVVDEAGDLYVTGYAVNGSGNGDIYTVKYSGSNGDILWQQAEDTGGYDSGADIGLDPVNGNLLVAGTSFINAGNHDYRLIRYEAEGNGSGGGLEVWNKRLDLSSTDDSLTAMAIDQSGVAILTGQSEEDILTVKLDHDGIVIAANLFDGAAGVLDYPADVTVNNLGEAFVAGSSMNSDAVPNTDFVVFKVDGHVLQSPTPFTATQLYAEVDLSWTDNDLDGTGFVIERKLDGCSSTEPWVHVVDLQPDVLSYVDTPVNDNSSYCYRIRSESATAASRWAVLEVTTADALEPTDLAASLLNDTDIELTWTDNTTAASDYEFVIERCSGVSCDFSVKDTIVVSAAAVTDVETGVATYIDSSACAGSPYRYRVMARKPSLWWSPYSVTTDAAGVEPVGPTAPTSLVADRVSETLVDLSWNDNTNGESHYVVERCDGDAASCASGVFLQIGTLPSISDNILQMRMDEVAWNGTANEVVDRSGSGNHGTASGASTTVYGRYARGGKFSDETDLITTNMTIDQSETGSGATMAAWVRPGDVDGFFTLFDTDDGGFDWSLLHDGTNWLLATGADNALVDTGVSVDKETWQYITATFDPVVGIKLYKNGVEVWAEPDIDPDTETGIGFDNSSAALTLGMVDNLTGSLQFLHMDEASWTGAADDVVDSSSSDNHGTSVNGAQTVAEGRYGRAGSFDGIDDHITTSISIDQSSTTAGATFEAWVYPTINDYNYRHLISTENGGYDWSIVQRNGLWYVCNGTSRYSTGTAVTLNEWQHVSVVFDPAVGFKFYKNGANTSTVTNLGYDTNTANLIIGRQANSTSSSYHFGGKIDDVVIYDRPLSAEEVWRRAQKRSFAGTIDEVAVFDRSLDSAEISTLYQHGIARYTDSTISVNNDYTYRVRAGKAGGCDSDWVAAESSALGTRTTPPAPDVTAIVENIGRVRLAWIAHTTTQDGFKVLRCEGAGCTPSTLLDDTLTADARAFTDTTTCADKTYRYQVVATDSEWGDSEPSSVVEGVVPALQAPTGLLVADISEGHASLEWSYGAVDADGFQVGYCDSSGSCSLDSDFTMQSISGLPSGNQLLLHMDETVWVNNASDIADASGFARHATSYNGAYSVSTGKYGWAGAFDGSNDYLVAPVSLDQSQAGPGATLEAWAYPTSKATNYRHVVSTENGGYDWSIVQYNGYWYVFNGNGRYGTGIPVTYNEWQHVVAIFEPGVGIRFYKNALDTYSNANIGYDSSSGNVVVGRQANSTYVHYHFAGLIDEVAVYNRPLTLAEVEGRYSANKFYFTAGVLVPEVTYRFRVKPYRNDPCSSEGPAVDLENVATTTTTVVPAPAGFMATDVGTTRVDLAWTDETTSETRLRVERCTGTSLTCGTDDANFTDFSEVLGVDAVAYSDENICAESDYTYRVRSERDTAPVWQSDWAYVERSAQTLPTITTLVASGISESEVLVVWDDQTTDEDEFVLLRCQDTDFSCGTPDLVSSEPASVAVYHMDEATWVNGSADVVDSSSSVAHAISYSGAATQADGQFDRSGNLTGTSDYIATPVYIDQATGSPGATFQAWVYPTETSPSYQRHVISTENGGYDWSITQFNGYWYIYTGSNSLSTGIPVTLNEWQHLAAVFDPGNGVRFYKNGGVLPSDVYSSATIGYDTAANNLVIGRYASSTSTSYNYIGWVDEVSISRHPWSAAEILANYADRVHSFTDSGLLPGYDYTYQLQSLKNVTDSNPDGCDWQVSAIYNTTTLAPPAPESLTTDDALTTEISLSWVDKSGSETDYQLERCADTLLNCGSDDVLYNTATFPSVNLLADTEAYHDDCAEVDTIYTYRVRARKAPYDPPGWSTGWIYHETSTTPIQPITGFNVSRVSEVQVDIEWDDSNLDETGFEIDRCMGDGCDFSVKETFVVSDSSAHIIYHDDELEPEQTYRYRVRAFKTVPCVNVDDWYTDYTVPQQVAVSVAAPNLTSALEKSTTRIDLDWISNAPTATETVIERCDGNPCSGSFDPVATVGAGVDSYSDEGICENSTYSYRVKSTGSGLSQSESGCWTRKAKLTFAGFAASTVFEMAVAYDDDMRSDFADLRFFDATAKRELPYWIVEIIDQGQPTAQAIVQFETWHNDNVYLYYGNVNAESSSNRDAFVMFSENFAGSQIDSLDWIELDNSNYITQDDGLQLHDLMASYSWSAALKSQATFNRSDNLELYAKVSIPDDTDGSNYFMLGWLQDEITSTSYSYSAHNLYWSNTYLHSYEGNSQVSSSPTKSYSWNNDYEIRVVPVVDGGAYYYARGGEYPDWTLIVDSTVSGARYTGATMRVGLFHAAHQATINEITVRKAVNMSGAAVEPETTVDTCSGNPGYTWQSGYSTEDVWETTREALAPTLDSVVVLDDTAVELLWTNNSDPDSYVRVERCCGSGCSYEFVANTTQGAASYTDTTVPASSNCSYQLYAHKDAGACTWDKGPSNSLAVDTSSAAASNLLATVENSRLIRLNWDDNASDEDGYSIEVRNGNGHYVKTADVGANSIVYYDGRNIEPQKEYSYRIRSYRRIGSSEPYSYEWSAYSYSNTVTTPAWADGDSTCLP